MAAELPDRARVVVVGGGVIGASIAYHLAHLGWGEDVVLLGTLLADQRHDLARGGADDLLRVVLGDQHGDPADPRDLYARLEAETGQATGFELVDLLPLLS